MSKPDLECGIITFLVAVDDCAILLMVVIKSTLPCQRAAKREAPLFSPEPGLAHQTLCLFTKESVMAHMYYVCLYNSRHMHILHEKKKSECAKLT
jgi:hypothetical protein